VLRQVMPRHKENRMAERRIYMDYNATTPLREEVKAGMIADFEVYGNASSMHASGRKARERVEAARRSVAALIHARPEAVVFTSGGSESNNTVFQTMLRLAGEAESGRPARNEIVTTAIEHPCVLNAAAFTPRSSTPACSTPRRSSGLGDTR